MNINQALHRVRQGKVFKRSVWEDFCILSLRGVILYANTKDFKHVIWKPSAQDLLATDWIEKGV